MTPLPPTRFSATSCCPKASLSRADARRPITSIFPPAAKGTRTLTGRWGQVCACALWPSARSAQARSNMWRKPSIQILGEVTRALLVAVDALTTLVTLLRLDREGGNRARFQSLERDRLPGLLTVAVG